MKKYTVIYDTPDEVNKTWTIEADSPADASDAFYYEIESEEEVTNYYIVEG